jgi:hypothetical protein
MSAPLPMAGANVQVNAVGLTKNDYRGLPTTSAKAGATRSARSRGAYEWPVPEKVLKFSGAAARASRQPTS